MTKKETRKILDKEKICDNNSEKAIDAAIKIKKTHTLLHNVPNQ